MKEATILIDLPAITAVPSATEAAIEQRDQLVLAAAGLQAVCTAESAAIASDHLKALAAYERSIETARKKAKGPIDEIGKTIQAVAKGLTDPVSAQKTRISGMLGTYQTEQQRLAREAQQKAWEEEQRILREADEKARKAEASGRGVDKKLEKIEAQTFEKVAEVRADAAALAAPRLAGLATRNEVAFEVTDIHALYAARPELVKLEVNTAALKNLLKSMPNIQLAGVKHWTEAKTIVR